MLVSADDPLLLALREPGSVVGGSAVEWNELLRSARQAKLLSRLALLLDDAPGKAGLPQGVRDQLAGARPVAAQHERLIRWEVDRIRAALRPPGIQIVLLKGAAYVLMGIPAGRGRLVSDIDILVPRERLADAEAALSRAGWSPKKLDPYDDRYYRDRTHELPPLLHQRRRSILDVHHTILQPSGRLHPDPRKLLESAVSLEGDDLFALAPADMVLHSCSHLFQDGDLAGGLRDLVDIDSLLRHFGAADESFWERLVPRAAELGLVRPLYYGLRYARALFRTPIPRPTELAARVGQPPPPYRVVMDALALRALSPDREDRRSSFTRFARFALYVRSHWLRMPPWQLTLHLSRKAFRRWKTEDEDERA